MPRNLGPGISWTRSWTGSGSFIRESRNRREVGPASCLKCTWTASRPIGSDCRTGPPWRGRSPGWPIWVTGISGPNSDGNLHRSGRVEFLALFASSRGKPCAESVLKGIVVPEEIWRSGREFVVARYIAGHNQLLLRSGGRTRVDLVFGPVSWMSIGCLPYPNLTVYSLTHEEYVAAVGALAPDQLVTSRPKYCGIGDTRPQGLIVADAFEWDETDKSEWEPSEILHWEWNSGPVDHVGPLALDLRSTSRPSASPVNPAGPRAFWVSPCGRGIGQ